MVVIRQQQAKVLEQAMLLASAIEQARRHFPDESAAEGDEFGEKVRDAMKRAAAHGFSLPRDIFQFVNLTLVLGDRFDTELPWARDILAQSDPAKKPFRATRLFESATRWLRRRQERRS